MRATYALHAYKIYSGAARRIFSSFLNCVLTSSSRTYIFPGKSARVLVLNTLELKTVTVKHLTRSLSKEEKCSHAGGKVKKDTKQTYMQLRTLRETGTRRKNGL